MSVINRLVELAGLPATLTEGRMDASLARNGMPPAPAAARLFGLYVGLRGSGELTLQFSGDRSDCLSQWHDDLKRDYKRGEAVVRVLPIYGDDTPTVIAESVEEGEAILEDVAVEDEIVNEEVKTEDDASPALEPEKAVATVKIPADVSKAIAARISELKRSMAQFNDKGYDDGGVKQNAIEALEQVVSDLATEDGLTKANIFFGTLMSPIQDMFPPKVVKFLHTVPAAKTVNEADEKPERHDSERPDGE